MTLLLLAACGSAPRATDSAAAPSAQRAAPPSDGAAHWGSGLALTDDIDGDGLRDLLVGAPASSAGAPGGGAVAIWRSPASSSDDALWMETGSSAGEALGTTVADAGDVDGDGHRDILLGAPGASASDPAEGRVELRYGPDFVRSWSVTGGEAGARLGSVMSAGGDLDGDGYGDFLVGVPSASTGDAAQCGRLDVYLGGPAGPTLAMSVDGNGSDDRLARRLAIVGDTDGDGRDDALVAAWSRGEERLYRVLPGSPGGLDIDSDRGVKIQVFEDVEPLIARAGDVNADGLADYLGLVPFAVTAARGYLWRGGGGNGADPADWEGEPPVLDISSGAMAWTGVGDLDGDGFDDLGAVSVGHVELFRGTAGALDPTPWHILSVAGSPLGPAMAVAGDLDGDGADDLYVAAPDLDPGDGADVGRVLLVSSGDLDTGDCSSAVAIGRAETCDGVDNDCDGVVDDSPSGVWAMDEDGDGYGVAADVVTACTSAEPRLPDARDCDDAAATVHPDASEVCDGVDNDCDGSIDEGMTRGSYYPDADGDGYGSKEGGVTGCPGVGVFVYRSSSHAWEAPLVDCDDSNPAIHPEAEEVCDGLDNDCLRPVDEDVAHDEHVVYRDTDGDGYGALDTATLSCSLEGTPTGYVGNGTDCDDADATVHPGATERCDGRDEDCDGRLDDGTSAVWFIDDDGDGFGAPGTLTHACEPPERGVPDGGDCDDADATVYPGAAEACDHRDDDCDAQVDEGFTTVWFTDVDTDGFGAASTRTFACVAPLGAVAQAGDCDDADATVYPGAAEACDHRDNDCDAHVDEGLAVPWYADSDGDAWGTRVVVAVQCDAPVVGATRPGDCDDGDAAIHPGEPERPGDGVDQDCDGWERCFADSDGDGYRTGTTRPGPLACDTPGLAGLALPSGDCADVFPDVHPGAVEVCDQIDNDCDGLIDDHDPDAARTTWYRDADTDGHGDPDQTRESACPPEGWLATADDCDDTRADVSPDEEELPDDGLDNDCDGEKAKTPGLGASEDTAEGKGADEGSAAGCGCAAAGTPDALAWLLGLVAVMVTGRRAPGREPGATRGRGPAAPGTGPR